MKRKPSTSWGKSADWYSKLLKNENTYQTKVILPNLLRQLNVRAGERILDLACGEGFFARALARFGATVIGVDLSPELIAIAKKQSIKNIEYKICSANKLNFLNKESVDKAICVLSLQNIEEAQETLKETARVLKRGGEMILILNHPTFRIPEYSSWGWDDATKTAYRRIDRYLSENKVKIFMHPGDTPVQYTITFHRPLQFYFKAITKSGLSVIGLEEWTTHRKTGPGPRQQAEDKAKKEIPLFLALKIRK